MTCGVKQGDNLAPILFVMFLNTVTTTLESKWKLDKPDFRCFLNTKTNNKIRGKFSSNSWKNRGEIFSFFQSFYLDNAAFITTSQEDANNAIILLVKYFKRFG